MKSSEAELRKLRCPMQTAMVSGPQNQLDPRKAISPIPVMGFCVGSDCAAYRNNTGLPLDQQFHFCGLAGKPIA